MKYSECDLAMNKGIERHTAAGPVLYALLRVGAFLYRVLRWIGRGLENLQRALGWNPGATRPARYWQNAIGNQFTTAHELLRPTSLDELVAIVSRAAQEGRRVRAVGAGHSFSDVAITDDYVVDMHGMHAELPVDPAVLRPGVDATTLYRVESGIRIRQLNRKLAEKELALQNMGGYDVQTISGAVSTATHGSGHALGPLCDAVESLVLVHGAGRVTLLEPSDGITDPAAYQSRPADGIELVQDDDLFYSAVVAMGSMGIVASYTLRVRKAFLLKECRTLKSWTDVRQDLLSGAPERVAHYELYVNPYPVRGDHHCLVTTREEVTDGARNDGERERSPVATMLTRFRFIDAILRWLFSHLRFFTPYFIHAALSSLVDDEYIDHSYKVFNLGDANLVPAFSAELAFDAGPMPGGVPAHVAGIDKILQLAAEQAAAGHWHSSPFGVRFVRSSRHHLAPQYGRNTCMVELPFLQGTLGAWDLLRYYERRFLADGARPHWGQATFALSYETTWSAYERFPAFLAAFAHFNPRGTFDNTFTQRLSLRAATRGWERKQRRELRNLGSTESLQSQ